MSAEEKKPAPDADRLSEVTLDESRHSARGAHPALDYERQAALSDLLADNLFRPHGAGPGPYHLHLRPEGDRLIFEVKGAEADSARLSLPLAPFRGLIKDYFLVCESYYGAIKSAPLARVEELDKSRRALHDEASALLRARMEGKVEIDFPTARRLFTLICVLHITS